MQVRLQRIVAGATLMLLAIAATSAEGQFLRRRPAPTQPVNTQPAPDQAVQQPNQPGPGSVAPANPAVVGQADAAAGHAHFVRGRSLIGMNIRGANQQNLGSVKDFIVDCQGDCPSIYFAVSPQVPGWNGDYVIVPFNALQVGFDVRQRTGYFTLDMTLDNLGRAPRLAADKWANLHDQQAFAGANQFYHRVERTAARPATGGREENPSLPANAPRQGDRSQPQTQQPLPTQQAPGAGQPTDKQPEQPKPAPGTQPNAAQPGTPNDSNQGRDKPDSENRDKPNSDRPVTR